MSRLKPADERLTELERENRLLRRQLLRSEQSVRLLQEVQKGNSKLLRSLLTGIEAEKEKSDLLLRNILPESVIERLSQGEEVIADSIDCATVVFSDFVGFTPISAKLTAQELVETLNGLYTAFDQAAQSIGIEKIKTIGDAYLAVSGLSGDQSDHAAIATDFALAIRDIIIGRSSTDDGTVWRMRVGVHSGPLTAGVIGQHKFAYDIWGDSVNVASRVQDACPPSEVLVSADTARLLPERFDLSEPQEVELKGRGRHRVYRVTPAA